MIRNKGGLNIMVLGSSFESDNLGVRALMAGTIEAIRYNFPQAEISLLDYGKYPVQFLYGDRNSKPIPLINIRYSKKIYLKNHVLRLIVEALIRQTFFRGSLNNFLELKNQILSQVQKADVVVALSGGDSFSDIYGIGRLLYVSLPQILALAMRKPLILLPQTLGPFFGKFSQYVGNQIMDRATLVYSRDYQGLKEKSAQKNHDDQAAKRRFCYDLGFLVRPTKPEHMDLEGLNETPFPSLLAGFNISGLLYRGGYSGRNEFGLKVNYPRLVDRIIHYLIKERGAAVLLVPHVFGDDEKGESDYPVIVRIYEELKAQYGKQIYLARGRYDQNEIKYVISLCHFFIGSRMHACIAAISQKIPTISIAYSKKFKGVMETVCLEQFVADPRTMDQEEILALIRKALEEKEAIRTHLESEIPKVQRRIFSLFQEIAGAIGIQTGITGNEALDTFSGPVKFPFHEKT